MGNYRDEYPEITDAQMEALDRTLSGPGPRYEYPFQRFAETVARSSEPEPRARLVLHHKTDPDGRELRWCFRCWAWRHCDENGQCVGTRESGAPCRFQMGKPPEVP